MIRDALLQHLNASHMTMRRNLEGIDHDASVRAPAGGGNSINWVLGHVVATRDQLLALLDAEPVMDARASGIYARGSRPLAPEEAEPLEELSRLLDESQRRIAERLEAIDAAGLERGASNGAEDAQPLGMRVSFLLFHDAYHSGQLGAIRRTLGLAGAIT